ncbi:MAG TPA: toll/interleukin-1 receptor domain-containing protein [Verrucomicrobiae bacterium]|jgi:hypothetical protein|nr:toll/interleukin-1 receptor domain-containing protein [Verrucomicrobiae bacterium]
MSDQGARIPLNIDPFESDQPALEDGTNILAGTRFIEERTMRVLPWYRPSEARGRQMWKENITKLRARFDDFIDRYCATEAYLIQTLFPQIGQHQTEPPGVLPYRKMLCRGPGLEKEFARLLGVDEAISAIFPILNVREEPFLEPDGKPTPCRLGLRRYIGVNAVLDELRTLPVPRLTELLSDGRSLIFELPAEIAVKIWRNWPDGFSQRNSNLIWLDMIFEMAWQRQRGSPFHIERYAWAGNGSVAMRGTGLFPRLPKFITGTPGEAFPHENGYPRAFYSKIPDVARASIAAIDDIFEMESDSTKTEPPRTISEIETKPAGTEMKKSVFISYSHKDKKFLGELLTHLKPLERAGMLTAWSDKQIEPGSKWFDEIQTALTKTKVAVLLVSANFLASNFIHEHELTPILKRAQEDGVRVLWIPVRHCSYKLTPISKIQAIIPPEKPLAEMKAERDKAWVTICEHIENALS